MAQDITQARLSTAGPLALGAFGLASFLWASEFTAIRVALEAYDFQHVVAFRYALAALTLAGYGIVTRIRLPRRQDIVGLTLTGFIGFTLFTGALTAGEQTVNAGTASLIISSAPIFTVLLAMLLLGERMQWLGWLGIMLGFIGIAIITVGANSGVALSTGAVLILFAAIAESIYFVVQKPFLDRYTPLEFTTYVIWMGTPLLWLFLPGVVSELRAAPPEATGAVLYLGMCVSVLAPASWAFGLSRTSASASASFLYLIPVLAVLISWGLLGEVPSSRALIGGVLVLAGVALVNR